MIGLRVVKFNKPNKPVAHTIASLAVLMDTGFKEIKKEIKKELKDVVRSKEFNELKDELKDMVRTEEFNALKEEIRDVKNKISDVNSNIGYLSEALNRGSIAKRFGEPFSQSHNFRSVKNYALFLSDQLTKDPEMHRLPNAEAFSEVIMKGVKKELSKMYENTNDENIKTIFLNLGKLKKSSDTAASLEALIYLVNPNEYKNYFNGIDMDHQGDITSVEISRDGIKSYNCTIRCGESKRKSFINYPSYDVLVKTETVKKAKMQLQLRLLLLKKCMEFIVEYKADLEEHIPDIKSYALIGILFTHGNVKLPLTDDNNLGITYEQVEVK